MVKNVLLVFVIVLCALGCAPQAENDTPGQATAEVGEVVSAEDFEGGDEVLEVPPAGSLPLSEIVAGVEIANHLTITEVEFEDGVWKVEFVMSGEEYELQIDPLTGEALTDEPSRTESD